jgi:hypothetical protein
MTVKPHAGQMYSTFAINMEVRHLVDRRVTPFTQLLVNLLAATAILT